MNTKDKQEHDKSQEPGTRAPNSVAPPAKQGPRSNEHRAQYGNDAIAQPEPKPKDGAGMPEGYKPDQSVKFVAGKEGKDGKPGTPDQIHNADGTQTNVSAANAQVSNAMETLPKDHTYRDRVEAQAKSLGIVIDPDWTLEYLMWVIRMKGSS